jgi:hypothetical protein
VAQQDVPSVAELVRIRPGLSPKFRQLPVEDLGVAGIFLAAKKDAGVVCEHD